jgi:hypothetical protein
MPTRRIFYLVATMIVLAQPAKGIVRLAARRWARETTGPLQTIGTAIAVSA